MTSINDQPQNNQLKSRKAEKWRKIKKQRTVENSYKYSRH